MLITAIDPGPWLSAYVVLRGAEVVEHAKVNNLELLKLLRWREPVGPVIVEAVSPRRHGVGHETLDTAVWVGRYLEAWRGVSRTMTRQEVKKALGLKAGGKHQATDADVRSALIVRWGGPPGKRQRPPVALAGLARDEWAALAVAVAWRELHAAAFAAVEEAPLSGLEGLNRALELAQSTSWQPPQSRGTGPTTSAPARADERQRDAGPASQQGSARIDQAPEGAR